MKSSTEIPFQQRDTEHNSAATEIWQSDYKGAEGDSDSQKLKCSPGQAAVTWRAAQRKHFNFCKSYLVNTNFKKGFMSEITIVCHISHIKARGRHLFVLIID